MISNLEKAFEDFEFKAELKGEIKGKLEEKSEVAVRLLGKGMEISFITEVTGLPKEEIEKLQKH
jgi:predicted transposase/invertase (TIGR01784 family)